VNREPAPTSGVIGYVPGVFDMFHVGHLRILQRAAQRCDVLVAGVVDDSTAFAMKGREPILPLAERIEIVSAIRCVSYAVTDRSADKSQVWELVRFHRIFKGNDWEGTEKGQRLEDRMRYLGVEVVYLPYTETTSSSLLRAAIAG
jgi:glycerol-3-phosphate cytidylyltransferase